MRTRSGNAAIAGNSVSQTTSKKYNRNSKQRSNRDGTLPPVSDRSPGMLVFTVIAFFLVVVLAGAVLFILSSRSLPGDRLYAIKLWSEQVRLYFTRAPDERLKVELLSDQRRQAEVEMLIDLGRVAEVEYSAQLEGADLSGEWIVGGLPILIEPDTEMVGDIYVGLHVTVSGQLTPQGEIIGLSLQPRIFQLEAKLNSIESNQWLVGGIPVTILPDTLIRGTPSIGSDVRVLAEMVFAERFIAQYIGKVDP